jgi:hypothetical protein
VPDEEKISTGRFNSALDHVFITICDIARMKNRFPSVEIKLLPYKKNWRLAEFG